MHRILKWTGIGIAALLLLLVLWYLFLFDWNDLKDHVATAFGDRTQREFHIENLDVRLALTSRIRMDGVRLNNAPWSEDPQMAEITSAEFSLRLLPLLAGRVVIPELNLVSPRLVLERNRDGAANWDFSAEPAGEVAVETAVPEERGEFPVIGRLVISGGRLVYRDPTRDIAIQTDVDTVLGRDRPRRDTVELVSEGRFAGKPFAMQMTAGSLLALREEDDPYPMDIDARIGDTRVRMKGTAVDPLRALGFELDMRLEGNDLAEVFPLFGIPLPRTRPYQLSGKVVRDGRQWHVLGFAGKVGDSDLAGDIRLDFTPEPPFMRAELVSTRLAAADLSSFFGLGPRTEARDERLIPETGIDFERLHAMELDVDFRAERIEAARVPLQRVAYTLKLYDGRLSFAPLRFEIAEGTVTGEIHLDSDREPAHLFANLRGQRLRLAPFLPDLEAAGVTYGWFGGRVQLEGSGNTVREVVGNGDGGLWLSMSGGAVDGLMIAAAGVDVPELLRLMGAEKTPVPLRCSVAAFDVKDGVMESNVIVIDAEQTTLVGQGSIDLRTEQIDLRLDGRPKETRPLVVGGAIVIDGSLRRPEFGLDLSGAAGQAGAALALSTLLAPLAAVIPFFDPGTGEDAECRELFAQARARVQKREDAGEVP